jgi:hypothetical protein
MEAGLQGSARVFGEAGSRIDGLSCKLHYAGYTRSALRGWKFKSSN